MAERSWTDAVTGASLLAGFDLVAYLQWLTRRSTRIEGALTQFLHEATHHWCFDSPVGAAVSQLLLRARRRALVGSGKVEELIEDIQRATVAQQLLHPLSEGLALFAEFDISPGKSLVESRTMSSVNICFGFPLDTKRDRNEMALQVLLQNTRRSAEYLERKAGIYALPFDCADGYLAGYLSVKAVWAALAARAPKLMDTDLFLAFLRSYVFDDGALVLLLVESDPDPYTLTEVAANHLRERFGALVDQAPEHLCARIDAWEQACESGLSIHPAIGVDEDTRSRAHDSIVMLMDDVQEEGPIQEYAAHAYLTAVNRQYMTLGRLAAEARRRAAGGVEVVGLVGADVNYLQPDWALDVASLSGELIAVTAYRAPALLLFFRAENCCQLVHSFGRVDNLDLEPLNRYVSNLPQDELRHAELEQGLEQFLAQSNLRSLQQYAVGPALKAAEQLYGLLATLQTESESVSAVLTKLRSGGLLELLDGDVELLRAIASIGLANTVGTDPASIALFAGVAGLGEALTARALATACERHGAHLMQPTARGGAIALV
jgi:hypothetical protein